jgi:K+-sensing histidine kinase KdpD
MNIKISKELSELCLGATLMVLNCEAEVMEQRLFNLLDNSV